MEVAEVFIVQRLKDNSIPLSLFQSANLNLHQIEILCCDCVKSGRGRQESGQGRELL
jgi:hypothetical protein